MADPVSSIKCFCLIFDVSWHFLCMNLLSYHIALSAGKVGA